jgi:hypothetical protein
MEGPGFGSGKSFKIESHAITSNIPAVLDALIQEVANAEKDLEYVTGTRNQISTFFRSRLNIFLHGVPNSNVLGNTV